MAIHTAKLTDATLSPHLHRVVSLGHQNGVAILALVYHSWRWSVYCHQPPPSMMATIKLALVSHRAN